MRSFVAPVLVFATLVTGWRVAPPAVARPVPARIAVVEDTTLRSALLRRIAEEPGATVGLAFRPVGDGDGLDINGDAGFHAASTMKVPVMLEVMRRVDAGALSLLQDVLLVNRFASIADGSPFTLDPVDDSDSSMYERLGSRVSIRELTDRMITRSSNLATNALIALVDPVRVSATASALGTRGTHVLRGVEDQKAFDLGLVNTTTAADLAALLVLIARDRAATPTSCALMREILLRQEFNERIPAGVPPGTPVAHKTGDITAVAHDAAIVFPAGRPPYVLVVLTKGITDVHRADSLIADLSRLVWRAMSPGAMAP